MDILYQRNITSGVVTKSFYAGGVQVAKTVGSSVFYLHQDALGSTVLTMTATVTPAFRGEYVPYGPSFAVTGTEAFQYTGKLLDESTGLYYEGARYYDPATGRFVTEDSVAGTADDPMSLDRYAYARDDPMKVVDVDGHEWWDPVADVSAAATDFAGELSDVANSVSNAWSSLPPDVQDGIIIGAAVGVTIAAAASCGLLAPAAAVVDASAMSTLGVGTLATVGAGVTADIAPDIESGVTSEIIPQLSRLGTSLTAAAEGLPIRQLSGFLGEEFTNAQTGDVNNGMLAEKLGVNSMAIVTEAGETIPDSLDHSFGSPPVGSYVRVGGYFSWNEFYKVAAAIDSGAMRPGTIYALKSPITGAMGPSGLMENAFEYIGFSIIKIDGPWWRF